MNDDRDRVPEAFTAPAANLDLPPEDSMPGTVERLPETTVKLLEGYSGPMLVAALALMVNWLPLAVPVAMQTFLAGHFPPLLAILVLLGARLILPGINLLKCRTSLRRAAARRDADALVQALERHRLFWKSMGLVLLLVALIYLLPARLLF